MCVLLPYAERWRAAVVTADIRGSDCWTKLGERHSRDDYGKVGREGLRAGLPTPLPGSALRREFTRQPSDPLLQRPQELLLLLMLRWPAAHAEDPDFPHLGDSSQPMPRPCPWRCFCPREDTVDCAGLDLRVFPDNITTAARHLSLQVRAGVRDPGRHKAQAGPCGRYTCQS